MRIKGILSSLAQSSHRKHFSSIFHLTGRQSSDSRRVLTAGQSWARLCVDAFLFGSSVLNKFQLNFSKNSMRTSEKKSVNKTSSVKSAERGRLSSGE